jgi:hypothetical protein
MDDSPPNPISVDPLLQTSGFDPPELHALSDAFDSLCRELRLIDTDHELREFVAAKVIALASRASGIRTSFASWPWPI